MQSQAQQEQMAALAAHLASLTPNARLAFVRQSGMPEQLLVHMEALAEQLGLKLEGGRSMPPNEGDGEEGEEGELNAREMEDAYRSSTLGGVAADAFIKTITWGSWISNFAFYAAIPLLVYIMMRRRDMKIMDVVVSLLKVPLE